MIIRRDCDFYEVLLTSGEFTCLLENGIVAQNIYGY
jgi:hypothetical protein